MYESVQKVKLPSPSCKLRISSAPFPLGSVVLAVTFVSFNETGLS